MAARIAYVANDFDRALADVERAGHEERRNRYDRALILLETYRIRLARRDGDLADLKNACLVLARSARAKWIEAQALLMSSTRRSAS